MSRNVYRDVIVEGISVPVGTAEADILRRAEKKMKRIGVKTETLHFRLYKKSVDARRKDDIRFVCSVLCQFAEDGAGIDAEAAARLGLKPLVRPPLTFEMGQTPLVGRPLVVGMGPAGLFCAYILAMNGYAPILIDRGDSVADRVKAVERFYAFGVLDTESNIQFGAGGAGTFSDGKLLTRINDARCAYVLETFCRMGAPEEILVSARPHVGTDILRGVVQAMLDAIEQAGGTVCYRCCLTDIRPMPDGGFSVATTAGEWKAGAVVLALGNSARDTFRMLLEKNFLIEPKPISVGVRIEHLREDVDRMFYGPMAGHPDLGAAEYHFSDTRGERGVYTFCMCPGGEVVAGASEDGTVVVNGMSYHARDGKNSNSAIVVSVHPEDFEPVENSRVLGAIAFQHAIEQRAFGAGGSNYNVPLQTVGDFLEGIGDAATHEPTRVQPSYMGGGHYRLAPMTEILPPFVCSALQTGLCSFDRKQPGFAARDAILSGAETRTSSPLRIMRGEDLCAVGYPGIYPCGEGAGYAGGITSAAVDGIRVAQALMQAHAPERS